METFIIFFISYLMLFVKLWNHSLREKCPNTKFFLVLIFLYSIRIQENTDQKKNPDLDTFYPVILIKFQVNTRN